MEMGPVFPEWLGHVQIVGIIAGALIPTLMLIRTVRAWVVATLWEPIRSRLFASNDILRGMRTDIHTIKEQMSLVIGMSRAQADANMLIGLFECAADGSNTYVNRTYARWMQCNTDDLLQWGFLTYTHPDHRVRVRSEWEECRREHRPFFSDVPMGPPGGPYISYSIRTRPVPESPPAKAWSGTIQPTGEPVNHDYDIVVPDIHRSWGDDGGY